MDRVSVIVPTYNAGKLWPEWIRRLKSQDMKIEEVIVIDSSSTDCTRDLAKQAGFSVHIIAKDKFNHGGTRNFAASLCREESDILVFLTQDALLAKPDSLRQLVDSFQVKDIAAAYGRQTPHKDANPIASHARLFNYPPNSSVKGKADIVKLGIKTAFISNSFSAYRREIFEELGGFPKNTILAEDMYLAARMVLDGYQIAYSANAQVFHSHNYSLVQEFRRYFDTGVFQANEKWIMESFGGVSGEGKRFVLSELRYLWKFAPLWIPVALMGTLSKFIGFKLGLSWKKLPNNLRLKFSMHKSYWFN